MLPRVNGGVIWMEDKKDEDSGSWNRSNININNTNTNTNTNTATTTTTTTITNNNNNKSSVIMENRDEMGSFSAFKSILDDDWFVGNNTISTHQDIRDLSFTANLGDHHRDNLLPSHHNRSLDSSSSCSPSSSVFNNLNQSQVQYLLQPKPSLSSILNFVSSNPLDHGFDLSEIGFLDNQATNGNTLLNRGNAGGLGSFTDLSHGNPLDTANLFPQSQLPSSPVVQPQENGAGFSGFQGFEESPGNAMFLKRSELLRPLESFPSVGSQPTLFQKRAALRKNSADNGPNLGVLDGGNVNFSSGGAEVDEGKKKMGEENEKRESNNRDDVEDLSIDGSALNYDSDEFTENTKAEEIAKSGGNTINANSSANGEDQKGKKKGLPAKNLMAERRRRKKLNDRLYMLRSVVPKISKMDRASILGDAIEYLKELLQRINDLHNELESTPPSSSLTPTTSSFRPLTPTPAILPSRVKDELCPSPLPSLNGQTARVEVRLREGKAVNIHMFCGRRPGLLLSIMRALDNLGLDIQQAVISSFNGFSMDIFRAEQCKEGQEINPEHIKAILLESAGFNNMM